MHLQQALTAHDNPAVGVGHYNTWLRYLRLELARLLSWLTDLGFGAVAAGQVGEEAHSSDIADWIFNEWKRAESASVPKTALDCAIV